MTRPPTQIIGSAAEALRPAGGMKTSQPRRAAVGSPDTSRVRRLAFPPLALLAMVSLAGLPYYGLPIAERVRHPFHAWMKPSGYVGQSAGILTLALFVFMWLYPLRKRYRRLSAGGSLKVWLDVHIAAGLIVPVVGAIHAGWRFNGLIGLGYLAMLVVSLSGIAGRYLYLHIPRGRSGLELTLEQVAGRRLDLVRCIVQTTQLDPREVESQLALPRRAGETPGLAATLTGLLAADLTRLRVARGLRRRWSRHPGLDRRAVDEAIRLASRQIALSQQVLMLNATQRVFRFWHVAHLPFAITAFAAVLIHVAVAVALGVTWLW